MGKIRYPYDLESINPFRKKQENTEDILLKQKERDEAITFFLKTVDYKSMDAQTLAQKLNRFLDGNLRK